MSLNRYEQMLYRYLESRPEERRYWEARVVELAKRVAPPGVAARELDRMLWAYFEERSRFESPFREVAIHEGLEKVSMLNLAEYLLRLWGPPPKRRSARPPREDL